MILSEFRNKKVKLVCNDGQTFCGKTDWYSPPQDSEDNLATICIGDYEFKEDEIKSIEIADDEI